MRWARPLSIATAKPPLTLGLFFVCGGIVAGCSSANPPIEGDWTDEKSGRIKSFTADGVVTETTKFRFGGGTISQKSEYSFTPDSRLRIGNHVYEYVLSGDQMALAEPGKPATTYTRKVVGAAKQEQGSAEKRQQEVKLLDAMVSGDRYPDSFDSGRLLLEHVEQLAKEKKFTDVARLLPKIEALPESALPSPPLAGGSTASIRLNLTDSMEAVATILEEHKQYPLAERLLKKAVAGSTTIDATDYGLEKRGDLSKHLAKVRADQGKFDQSANDLQLVLKAQGSRRSVLSQQGAVYLSQRKYAEAEKAFQEMYESTRDDTGHNYNSWPIEALRGVGKAQFLQGKYSDACNTYGEVLRRLKQSSWQQNAYIAQDFTNYAKVLRQLNRDSEAAEVETERSFLPSLPSQYASTYRDQHKFDLD